MIREEYFRWLCDFIFIPRRKNYKRLVKFLFGVEFTYSLGLDEDRAEDGIDLRSRFASERDHTSDYIKSLYRAEPCSVLEMMIALSIRFEENIMNDPEIGDRTESWFWIMIDNCGMSKFTDSRFNSDEVGVILSRILNREYNPNGEGSMFPVYRRSEDMREVEIWYQIMWYLDEYLEEYLEDKREYEM